MTKTTPPADGAADDAALVDVRALIDNDRLGLKAGAFAQVPAAELDGLKAEGAVDDSAEAVAYAKSLAKPAAA